MRKVPFSESVRIIGRGVANWFAQRPIVVSFEVTDACTCYCRHCDHGGPRDMSRNLAPKRYRDYVEVLRPCVVQVSGGEPLVRDDILDVVRNIKLPSGLPYAILVSNWSLMTEEKYLALRAAGINQFSVSLDFPDERHDDFRGHPGLFSHLNQLIPRLAALGHDDIVLNNCITAQNLSSVNAVADQARAWGVNVSYSAYSARRTGCRDYFLNTPEQVAALRGELARIRQRMNGSNWIVNSKTTLDATFAYFQRGGASGCKAGLRFLVVSSDGALQPCSMQFERYDLKDQARMIESFTEHNTCDQCYVAIRSYLDKSLSRLLRESVGAFFSFKSRRAFEP